MKPNLLAKFKEHKYRADRRGIPFLLTYDEWLKIWEDSGHLHERGNRHGQYVMARYGDAGPYSIGNVRIITAAENRREHQKTIRDGRRPRHAPVDDAKVLTMKEQGLSPAAIARTFGVTPDAVYRVLHKAGLMTRKLDLPT
jgi:hypothetical protein